MKNKKNKKTNTLSIFMALSLVVFVFLLFYIVGVLLQFGGEVVNKNKTGISSNVSNLDVEFASYFPECDLIVGKCLDASCDQYFLCSDKKYLICEVYDCGSEFGIGTKDENKKIDIKKEAKYDVEKIGKAISKCEGSVEIVSKSCVNKKLELKTKVTTVGDCKIENFWASYSNGENGGESVLKLARFSNLGDSLYLVSLNDCSEISGLVAAGEGGVKVNQ